MWGLGRILRVQRVPGVLAGSVTTTIAGLTSPSPPAAPLDTVAGSGMSFMPDQFFLAARGAPGSKHDFPGSSPLLTGAGEASHPGWVQRGPGQPGQGLAVRLGLLPSTCSCDCQY